MNAHQHELGNTKKINGPNGVGNTQQSCGHTHQIQPATKWLENNGVVSTEFDINNGVVSSTMSEVMALMDNSTDTVINIDVHNINLFDHFKNQ